jgi:pantoate--beta-alanine ligase
MTIVRTIDQLRSAIGAARPVFVPTMGALHAGHLALVRRATEVASSGAPVVVSIFVNPTQFGPTEDFSRYPRMLDSDARAATTAGATIIFAPEAATIYPSHEPIAVPPLPDVATQPHLEDAFRPAHFAGVCQVVARLFDLMQPSSAVFGEKDYQQLLVIKAMVEHQADRWPELRIIAQPTVREPDGLAMSSRNAYLKRQQRDHALGLFRALRAAQQLAAERAAIPDIERTMRDVLHEHELKIEYAALRDAATLMPIDSFANPARALIAARLGSVRLIDNLAVNP